MLSSCLLRRTPHKRRSRWAKGTSAHAAARSTAAVTARRGRADQRKKTRRSDSCLVPRAEKQRTSGEPLPLQDHNHHRMVAQLAVETVELLPRRGADHAGDAQVLSLLARPHAQGAAVEVGGVTLHDFEHRLGETRLRCSQYLDREFAGILDQRLRLFHLCEIWPTRALIKVGSGPTPRSPVSVPLVWFGG